MELNQLGNRMRALSQTLQSGVDIAQRDVAEKVLIGLAKTTPYDTGNARINWQVVLDYRSNFGIWDYRYRPPMSPKGGHQGASAGADAVLDGLPIIAAFNGSNNKSIHITNNADYIVELNKGRSKQAPPGFVQNVINTAARTLQRFRVFSFNRSTSI